MSGQRRRAALLGVSLVATFVVLRVSLAIRPDADFDVGPYNVHHLFTGLLLVAACGIPLAVGGATRRLGDVLVTGFGVGLGLALDEWVYLIATDGSNASYLLPVSFWGGLVMIAAAVVYTAVLAAASGGRR